MRHLFLLTWGCFLFILSCNQPENKQVIKVATLKGPSAIGMVKMIDSISQLENADYEFTIYNEPLQVRRLMLEGEVDFAVLPTTMGAILYNKGIEYALAAVPVWGTLYLFGNDTTINEWNDLKGKRVHLMAKGMTPDILFKHLLLMNNVNPESDVLLDYSFPSHIDLANAVIAGKADLAVISEPLVSLVMQKNKKVYPVFDLNKEWQKVYQDLPIAQTALLVNKHFFSKQPSGFKDFLKAYEHSTYWVNHHHKKAAKLIVKHQILPNTKVAESAIPNCNLKFTFSQKAKEPVMKYLSVFYAMNPDIVGGKMPDENFFIENFD